MLPPALSRWLLVLILALSIAMPVRAEEADLNPEEGSGLPPQAEAALYTLNDPGPVDLSAKTVELEIYVAPQPELHPFLRLLPQVWPRVQGFYARLGVNLVQLPGQATPGELIPARRLRLEVLSRKEWLARSFRAFKVAPPFRFRFIKVCEGKFAYAHLPLSVIHFSYKRYQDALFSDEPGQEPHNARYLANLLIHELGHLMGLYHAHEFVNDPIPEYGPDGRTPNFMGHDLASKAELGFSDFQKLLVHSYLGQGKVFQQYRQVDFDPLRYLELIKRYNAYREPGSETRSSYDHCGLQEP